MKKINKIFGIGLPRTGNTSLKKALRILNYSCVQHTGGYVAEKTKVNFRKLAFEGNYNFPGDWDAIVNFGERFYPMLDITYPNSKFILTTRDIDSWLNSITKTRERRKKRNIKDTLPKPYLDVNRFVLVDIYSTRKFVPELYKWIYRTHSTNVLQYFENKGGQLLVLPVELKSKHKWTLLCNFLNRDIPDKEYPHEHKGIQI